ncbi:hypothetical protein ACI784_14670 [Geodermatophilus sp. SYSU D01186]
MSAPVLVTEAPADVPATAIGRLAKTDLSTVVMPLGSPSTAPGIASEVLRALGKNLDANGKARHGLDDVSLVPTWLTAHRTQTLIAAAPQHATVDNLLDLASMCAASPTTVVLAVDHGYGTRLVADLRSVLPAVMPWPSITEADQVPTTVDPNAWNPAAPSVLPDADFLTFYATARRTVSPERFASVDALYRDALSRTLEWIEQSGVEDLTEEGTRSAMAALIDEQVTFDEVTTAMAAAQVAFFRSGWFLKIDPRELRSGLLRFPSARIDAATWRRLRAYRDPARAATTALYLAGARPQDIRELTMADLAAWHHDRNRPVAGVTIPEEAEPYLLAHTLSRATFGPSATDPAFVGNDRRVLLDLRHAQTDLGLNLGDAPLADGTTHGSRRVNSRVFGLERIS